MANFLLLLLKRNEKRMKAVETRRRQRRISISKKAASRAVYDAKHQPQSKYFQDINANND